MLRVIVLDLFDSESADVSHKAPRLAGVAAHSCSETCSACSCASSLLSCRHKDQARTWIQQSPQSEVRHTAGLQHAKVISEHNGGGCGQTTEAAVVKQRRRLWSNNGGGCGQTTEAAVVKQRRRLWSKQKHIQGMRAAMSTSFSIACISQYTTPASLPSPSTACVHVCVCVCVCVAYVHVYAYAYAYAYMYVYVCVCISVYVCLCVRICVCYPKIMLALMCFWVGRSERSCLPWPDCLKTSLYSTVHAGCKQMRV